MVSRGFRPQRRSDTSVLMASVPFAVVSTQHGNSLVGHVECSQHGQPENYHVECSQHGNSLVGHVQACNSILRRIDINQRARLDVLAFDSQDFSMVCDD